MSNNDTPVANVTTLNSEETAGEETKTSFVQKTKTFARNHKKPLIAVGALAALVGVSAVTGRKSASVTLTAQSPFELESAEIVDAEIVEDDTVTA